MTDLIYFLSIETGLPINDIRRIVETAPRRYKVYEIPKRNGGRREIAQPAKEVKWLQRILMRDVLSTFPVHDAATAYRTGLSIQENAGKHAGRGPILKLDFKDFFPSIRSEDWHKYALRKSSLTSGDINVCSRLFFKQTKSERILRLSIGAPTSPMLSNVLMFDFDSLVSDEATRRRIAYTRYADDMTFSGQRIGMLKDMIEIVELAIKQSNGPRVKLNHAKTVFATAATRRMVTGVILANDGSVGLGRDRKRTISAKVHYASLERLDADSLARLAGDLAFVKVVEPSFLTRLIVKYGEGVVRRIQHSVNLPVRKKATPEIDIVE